ncbi:MAG: histidine kinase [Spirosoma sp.]|nr:histidine kinase [Spirosoma sp.]
MTDLPARMTLLESLRQFPAFENVPDFQLQWLIDHSEEESLPAHHVINRPGDVIDHLLLVIDGQIVIDNGQDGAGDDLARYGPNSFMGLLPFSRMREIRNRVITEGPSRVLRLHRSNLRELAQSNYELTESLVQQMTTRVREFTRMTQQEDKMASLGRLSAGLAHELNNPVAAVVRSAATLREHMRATPEDFKAIMHLQVTNEQVESVNETFFGKIDRKGVNGATQRLSLMDRTSLEDDVTDWLDDHGIDDSVDLAGPLVEFGFTTDDLDGILEKIGEDNLAGITRWLVNNLVTEKLVMDISEASKRISTLVGSIKNYTHMDRGAGKESVSLSEGIRNTLTLLDHKLRSKHIDVALSLPDDLPMVCGWPGELNQVWTNLIDNAIDALPDGGQLGISSEPDRDFVLTKITDNGPGIPADIKDKIFEPFFTTKEIGKGTGLGLDIVQGVIKHHNGSIKLESKPGQTVFSICLPIQ